jgi:hypothetical protein
MVQLDPDQFDRWAALQTWLELPERSSWRFKPKPTPALRRYQCTIAPDCAIVGCNMSRCFLHDLKEDFPGGLLQIVRMTPDDDVGLFVSQLFRGWGVEMDRTRPWLLLDETEYDRCFVLVATALMFGWDANFVAHGRRFLLEMDDEPVPALITDSISPWFAEVVKNIDFKITELA